MEPDAVYRIGDTTIELWPNCVRTILPDGAEVVAAPNGTDTLADCADHEIAHTHSPARGRSRVQSQFAAGRCKQRVWSPTSQTMCPP